MEGLFTILGTLFGFMLGSLRRYSGTVGIYPTNYESTFWEDFDPITGERSTTSKSQADSVKIQFDIELYNSKEVPIPLRNIQVSIQSDHQELFRQKVNDRSTLQIKNNRRSIETLSKINLKPHYVQEVQIRFTISDQSKIEAFNNTTEVRLLAEQPRAWPLWDRKVSECVKELDPGD